MRSLSLQFHGFACDEALPSFPDANAEMIRESLLSSGYDALLLRGLPIDPLEVFIEDDNDRLIMAYLVLEHELAHLRTDALRHTLSLDSGRIWVAAQLDFSCGTCSIHVELRRYGHSAAENYDLAVSIASYVNTWRSVISQLMQQLAAK